MRLIISTMRDEGPYILEWVAYHRAIGFTDFLIYTNDCRDGTDLLLDRLAFLGLVRHVPNDVMPRRGPHKSALKYALLHDLYAQAEWVYVTDADEFLNIRLGEGRVDDLLARFPGADVLPVAWRMFSHDDRREIGDLLITETLTECEPETAKPGEEGRFVKSLFRPSDAIKRLGIHAPVFRDRDDTQATWGAVWLERDPAADPRRPRRDFGYEVAQVNHYALRSIDAFMMKRDRGRANHIGETLGLDYWNRWHRTGARDRSIQRHLPAVRAEMARLLDDPVLAVLHEGSRSYHEKRLSELLEKPDFRQLRDALISGQTSAPPNSPAAADPTCELQLKAPKRHQNRLKMLDHMPKGGRCAEIGVWNGGFSGAILEVTEPGELVLIDPWDLLAGQNESDLTHKKQKDAEAMRQMFDNVSSRFGAMQNVIIRKGFSAQILDGFPDDYFDWVYIDGNHLYDFVRTDLELSFRKVRPGGIVAGDDFFWKRDGRMHVREAVLDVMRARGMAGRPTRIGQQYMITVQG